MRRDSAPILPVHRAFVVHFSAASDRARRWFTGRVEHLSSGESARFSSLKGLLAFLAAILDAPTTSSAIRSRSRDDDCS
jgi:hypothetical protein